MVSKYDVLVEIIEKKKIKPNEFNFKSKIFNQLKELKELNYIKKDNLNYYFINENNRDISKIFNVLKICLENEINYNVLFSKSFYAVIEKIIKKDKSIFSNINYKKVIEVLQSNHFILVRKLKPKKFILLESNILKNIISLNENSFLIREEKNKKEDENKKNIFLKVLKLKEDNFDFNEDYYKSLNSSLHLENIGLTMSDTVKILKENIYLKTDFEKTTYLKNLDNAFNFLIQNITFDINLDFIKKLNELILTNIDKRTGIIRLEEVKIKGNSNFKICKKEYLYIELEKYFNFLKTIKTRENFLKNIGYIHNQFQYIHPFYDGNSRTTRLIINYFLINFNYKPLIIKIGAKDKYMSLTKLYEKRDDKKLNEFFLKLILHNFLI